MITKICFGNILKADICENGQLTCRIWLDPQCNVRKLDNLYICGVPVEEVEGCDNILGLLGCSANSMRNMF